MKYVALLRAVNVGGRNRVPMADLIAIATDLGLSHPTTLLQSGNLVFGCDGADTASLEQSLEESIDSRLGLKVDVVVLTPAELREAMEANPFLVEAQADPSHVVLVFTKSEFDVRNCDDLQAAIKGAERVAGYRRCLYAHYPDGIGDSKLTIAVIESKLKTRATGRNWTTVAKVAAIVGLPDSSG
ncbi:MAG: DUF1697 domain-containing protein [Fimbriimonas sp.]|nr:DUF1697 domain-containing protein [Fimbriimonas sp.]